MSVRENSRHPSSWTGSTKDKESCGYTEIMNIIKREGNRKWSTEINDKYGLHQVRLSKRSTFECLCLGDIFTES